MMPKIKIHIHQHGTADFDVRHSGKHEACATYAKAKAVAHDIQAAKGGFKRAIVCDHVGGSKDV